ncbi:MAG: hypothetical protein DLM70_14835 [Chloroflexi bacterium]|nr:MAG: hypothetical protein DLM70_14835 [Chloroflexota bacterium]
MLGTIVSATYVATRSHKTPQIHDQLVGTASDKLSTPDLLQILRQSPRARDEEEAVRTFVISRDGVLRDADAVTNRPPDRAAVTRVLKGAGPTFTSIRGPTGVLSVYTVPVLRRGRVLGAVQTITAETPYNIVLQYLLLVSLVVGGIGLLLAAALGILMANWSLRPIRVAITRQQEFAQNAAHELRAPLTVIRTAADLALRVDEPSEMREALTTTVRQTEHLDAVVGDLRLLAQGDTGGLVADLAPLDLGALVREVCDEVQAAAETRGIRLGLRAPSTLGMSGDRQRLRQLLMILVDNALRYTVSGGCVDIGLAHQGQKATLTVHDTGSGIQPRHLPRIFDRFYRAEEARSQDRGGAGLGLAIAREIVEAHGGQVTVQSRVGAGTDFRVTLPGTADP